MAHPASRALKVGLILPHWTALPTDVPYWWEAELTCDIPRWTQLLAMARQAEAARFDSLWLVDHLLMRSAAVNEQYGRPVPPALAAAGPIGLWECWSLLAALAERRRSGSNLGHWSVVRATAIPPSWQR